MSTLILGLVILYLLAMTVMWWLVYFLMLVALPLACIWIAWRIGRLLDRFFNTGMLRYLIPVASVALSVAWGLAGQRAFETACASVAKPVVYAKAPVPQDGIFVDTRILEQYGASLTLPTIDGLIGKGKFSYYEQRHRSGIQGTIPGATYSRTYIFEVKGHLDRNGKNTDVLQSKYAFTVLRVRRLDRWWFPPVHTVTYGIRELATNKVMAEADEVIFGGWVYGLYKRARIDPKNSHGGDYNYLACGYAAPTVLSWRPPYPAQVENQLYLDADWRLLSKVLAEI